jgi:hypothetical protein
LGFDSDQILLLERSGQTSTAGVTPTTARIGKVRDNGQEGEVQLLHHYRISGFAEPGSFGPIADVAAPRPFSP